MDHTHQETAEPTESKRLFIALTLPEAVREDLARQSERLQKGARFTACRPRWVRPEGMHLTLAFLGQTPVARIEAIRRELGLVAESFAPQRMEIKRFGRLSRLAGTEGAMGRRARPDAPAGRAARPDWRGPASARIQTRHASIQAASDAGSVPGGSRGSATAPDRRGSPGIHHRSLRSRSAHAVSVRSESGGCSISGIGGLRTSMSARSHSR